jgi:hypothetical protein
MELPFSGTVSPDWNSLVTQLRQDYSARLKSALLTSAEEYSSWPTARTRDWKDILGLSLDSKNPDGSHRNRRDTLVGAIAETMVFGPPDPEKSNTNGSRQGCVDATAVMDAKDPFGEPLWLGAASAWPTASLCGNHNRKGASARSGDGLSTAAKAWATPRSGKTTEENLEKWRKRNAEGKVSTMPLTTQVKIDKQEDSGNGAAKKLNPRWVETLMGVPQGWVSPEPVTPTTCTNRTDELRLLGNGVVPQTAAKAFTVLIKRLQKQEAEGGE